MSKIYKSILSAVLALIMALSVLTVAPFAAPANMAVSVDKTSCLQGSTFTATVYFPETYNKAAALDVHLKYDKTKLELVKMTKGAGLESALDSQINGSVYSEYSGNPGVISWVIAGSNNFDLNGAFAVIEFKVRDTALNGNTTLDLSVSNAANSGYVDITSSFITQDAEIEIVRNSLNDFEFELSSDGLSYTVTAYRCATVSDLTVPSTYKGLPVVAIADSVFLNHGELVNVTLPANLQSIGNSAFYACTNLKAISIPDTVTSIGEFAFAICTQLESVKLPLGMTEIKPSTFFSCYFLESVEIPFTVKIIGDNAFFNCYTLSKVKISKNTTSIGKDAFEKCPATIEFTTVAGNTYLPELISTRYPQATINLVEDISLGTAVCDTKDVEFAGAPITPAVKVNLTNGTAVAEGKEYEVVYVNNRSVGKAVVYVVGIDGYGEGYVINFNITCEHKNVKRVETQKELTCTQDGKYLMKCTLCGTNFIETVKAKGHPSGEWIYDKRPTVNATGIKHRVCTVCGKSYDLNTVAEKITPDVNLDKKVNSTDALLILQHSVGKVGYISPDGLFNADANADGKINSTDALLVLKISVGKT